MILSDADLLARLRDGDLVVEPLDDVDMQVQPASIDLRLGPDFLEFRRTNISCIHPNREDEVSEYIRETTVAEGDEFILHPGDFVLGTTKERVEVPPDLVANVEGRSSLGRLAVVVHASLPYDEEVFLWTPKDGFGFYEIGHVVENEVDARAVSFDPATLRVRTHDVTDYITNPRKRIYRVKLESGREVHVTKDHNVFTLDANGGVTRLASEDAVGELVMVPGVLPGPRGEETEIDLLSLIDDDDEDIVVYATDGFAEVDWSSVPSGSRQHYERRVSAPFPAVGWRAAPEDAEIAFKQSETRTPRYLSVTPELGWILGFYIAEGYARRKQLVFTNEEDAYLDRVAAWFGQRDVPLSRQEGPDGVSYLTVCSALWSKIFGELAGAGSEKNIPEHAWNWSNDVLSSLLDGLLDGDGHRRDGRSTLFTANEDLANRVTYLGSRLGRYTSTYCRDRSNGNGETRTQWAIDFYEDAHKRGQCVPNPSTLLRSLRREAGLTMADAAAAIGCSSKSSISNVENREYDAVKRDTLRELRDCYAEHGADVTRLDEILAESVRFERVVSVEATERYETTYDLEVQPDGRHIENFLGGFGGVFLSNTAGYIDPGYRGQVTLELSNLGTAPVALTPGMRISQLVFTELKNPADRPYGTERGSKYQDQRGPQASRIQDDPEFGDR